MGGIYELPSGKVEEKESLNGALVREVREETGYNVKVIGYICSFDYKSKSGKVTRQFNFDATIESGEFAISDEHECFVWVRPEQLCKFNVTKPVVNAIQISANRASHMV